MIAADFPAVRPLLTRMRSPGRASRFAYRHALHIRPLDAIYTFIPKNACSTFRYSVALANGAITGEQDFDWIHLGTATQIVQSARVLRAPRYAFVVLRCPYRRLVSAFLDKMRTSWPGAEDFVKRLSGARSREDLTFAEFVRTCCTTDPQELNEHWRPQSEFLIYERYDRYFRVEDMAEATRTLEEDIGFVVHDTRQLAGHATGPMRKRDDLQEPWRLTVGELRAMETFPTARSMYEESLAGLVRRGYADDIALYAEHFGTADLLFS